MTNKPELIEDIPTAFKQIYTGRELRWEYVMGCARCKGDHHMPFVEFEGRKMKGAKQVDFHHASEGVG